MFSTLMCVNNKMCSRLDEAHLNVFASKQDYTLSGFDSRRAFFTHWNRRAVQNNQ